MNKVAKWLLKAVFLGVTVVVVVLVVWTWGSLQYVYSRGERAGYVQKFSKKGWLVKTWEGELAQVNLPGAMSEKFFFSVRSDDIAKKVQDTLGQRVVLNYNEHRGVPTTFFGETSYFVQDVRVVEPETAPASAPPVPAI